MVDLNYRHPAWKQRGHLAHLVAGVGEGDVACLRVAEIVQDPFRGAERLQHADNVNTRLERDVETTEPDNRGGHMDRQQDVPVILEHLLKSFDDAGVVPWPFVILMSAVCSQYCVCCEGRVWIFRSKTDWIQYVVASLTVGEHRTKMRFFDNSTRWQIHCSL